MRTGFQQVQESTVVEVGETTKCFCCHKVFVDDERPASSDLLYWVWCQILVHFRRERQWLQVGGETARSH